MDVGTLTRQAQTAIKTNILCGTQYQPNAISSVGGVVVIPSDALAGLCFTVGCLQAQLPLIERLLQPAAPGGPLWKISSYQVLQI
jgi:hypothetical protein